MMPSNSTRWHLAAWITVLSIAVTGCGRSRSLHRRSGPRVPMPAPPAVSEGPDGSETPIELPPAGSPGQTGAFYGPMPIITSTAPCWTGSSRDIRYRQSQRVQAIPIEPPAISPPAPSRGRGTALTSSEIPITVPPARNGVDKPTAPKGQNGVPPTEEVTGIPRYSILEPNVATGGPPTLDGIKWLKERGFKTVLCLLSESEVDPAEASMVRELGLEYVALPITPRAIDRGTIERFNQLVDSPDHRPIFVHDSSGVRTGAMWFLHRVIEDRISEQQARSQAQRIGLQDSDTDFWLAIQRYLAEN